MAKNSFLYISGFISLAIYFLIAFIFIYYVVGSKPKTFDIKSKETVIQLDMIIEKSDKKRVAKKEKIKEKEPKKEIKKAASISNKKRPDLKSLFGNVKTKELKVKKEEVNNVKESIDPKRFKAKFQREKKSSNVKVDKLLNDKITTTNFTSKNISNNDESDEYFSKVNEMLSAWTPTTREKNLLASVIVTINAQGVFSYKFTKFSQNVSFNESLKAFLEEQESIIYPKPKKGKTVRISVNFRSEG